LAKGSSHIWRTWVGDALNMKRLEHTGMWAIGESQVVRSHLPEFNS
jgi:hypothetical protein